MVDSAFGRAHARTLARPRSSPLPRNPTPPSRAPWKNFTKFIVDREGKVHGPFVPRKRPADLERLLRRLLGLDPPAPDGDDAQPADDDAELPPVMAAAKQQGNREGRY